MHKIKSLQELGRFEVQADSDGDKALVLRESEQLREKTQKKYSKLREIVLPKPNRFNACFYERVDGVVRVNLGYRYANTLSSKPFFEYGGESFEFTFKPGDGLIHQIEVQLKHRTYRVVILKNPRDIGSIVGHSFHY